MEGSAAIKQGLDTLDQMLSGSGGMGDISQLADSSKAIKSGISGIAGGIGMVADELGAADMTSLAQSNADMIVLIGDISAYTPAEAQVLQPVVDLLSQNVGALNHAAAAYGVLTVGDLAAASAALDAQYGQFDSGIQSLAASLSGMAPLQAGIHDLAANYADFHKGLIKYAGGVDELRKGYGELHSGLAAVYVGAIELLGGIVQTKDGSYEIADGVNEFKDGVASFEEGLRRLYEGTTEYSDGTNTFYEETADMDSEIQTRLDDMLASLTGGDVPLVSFASKKNTDIRAVQFVMATEVIKLQEKELVPVDDAEDEDTFITRLKNLFQ
jgi:putative membrane protein